MMVSSSLHLFSSKEGGSSKPVAQSEGERLSQKLGAMKFFEVSAYTQQGLKEAFDGCIKTAFQRLKQRKDANNNVAAAQNEAQAKDGGCCLIV